MQCIYTPIFHENKSRDILYSSQGDVIMTQVIYIKTLDEAPEEVRELLRIQKERAELICEIDAIVQQYHPPGLNHPKFWSKEREAINNYKKLHGLEEV